MIFAQGEKMKKYIVVVVLIALGITHLIAGEKNDRKGVRFGVGVVALGVCEKTEIWDEKGENVIGTQRDCGVLPLVDVTLGYGLTPQFELSLDVKTLLFGTLIGIKTKYYMQDAKETSFFSLTGGAVKIGGGHGPIVTSYNNVEYGYAYGKNEFTVGAGAVYGESNILLHVGYKYMF